jgi:hypothetical protein
MTNIKNSENSKSFHCSTCYFTCSKNSNWIKHLSTNKHKNLTNPNHSEQKNAENQIYQCKCGKKYKHRSSLSDHKKKCNEKEDSLQDLGNLTNFVLEVVKNNQELQKQYHELQKQNYEIQQKMMEMTSANHVITNSNNHNTTVNNSHNKTFNLQFFLNETCKDAMNIMEFVDNMKIELTDLENIAQVGYVKGMSNLILKNLKALDVTQRPVHCSDSKREVVYVKDNNEWHNDQKEGEVPNQKLKKAIKHITNKNMKMIPQWKEKYPDCIYADSRKSTLYNNMYYHTVDSSEEHSDKIIKNIAREVIIQK